MHTEHDREEYEKRVEQAANSLESFRGPSAKQSIREAPDCHTCRMMSLYGPEGKNTCSKH